MVKSFSVSATNSVGHVLGMFLRNGMLRTLVIVIMFYLSLQARAQVVPVVPSVPPSMKHPLVPSHGSNLLGALYLAAGAEPHPTAILFHGFPGYEQNLDLARALRRAGWNVLAMHYRGSWGLLGRSAFYMPQKTPMPRWISFSIQRMSHNTVSTSDVL